MLVHHRNLLWALTASLAVWSGGLVSAQTRPAGAATRRAPSRWAFHMARAEAASKLTQDVKALSLPGGAKVADFLAESPMLEDALALSLLYGGKVTRTPPADQEHVEIALAMSMKDVTAVLASVRGRYYRGKRFRDTNFARLAGRAGEEVLRSTGRGEVPPALAKAPFIPARAGSDLFPRADAATKQFWLTHVTEATRAEAESAAFKDAMDRMAERIKRVRVDKDTLAEFVAKRDKTEKDFHQFLRARRIKGARYHRDAPVVEVHVEASLRTVYACVKAWLHSRKAPGQEIRLLERLIVASGDLRIRQAGIAAVDEANLKKFDARMLASLRSARSPPDWIGQTLRQTGQATPDASQADGRSRAIRAAELDARCVLAARLGKLPVTAATRVADLARKDEGFRTKLLALLQTARRVGRPETTADGAIRVDVELSLEPLWPMILRRHREAAPNEE